MANYYASCRSSYFKVRHTEKFLAWAKPIPGIDARVESTGRNAGLALLLIYDGGNGGRPYSRLNPETDEYEDFDLAAELAPHPAKGWCAILMEAGAEKLCYIIAQAIVVDWRGKVKIINARAEALMVAKRWKAKAGDTDY